MPTLHASDRGFDGPKVEYNEAMRIAAIAFTFGAFLLSVAGCRERAKPKPADTPEPRQSAELRPSCTPDPTFPSAIDLPEASAAAEVVFPPGTRELLVVSDGHKKIFGFRLPGGPGRPFELDLDKGASQDLEGMAFHGGKLYTLTSSGGVRVFVPEEGGGLKRLGDAVRIGPPPASCEDLTDKQCGPNYEGLCLRAEAAAGACAGYAASKADNALYCVRFSGDRLVVDRSHALPIEVPRHALSDCAFGAAGGPAVDRLFITTNSKGHSQSFIVDERTGALTPWPATGTASNEAIAIDRDGFFYAFADAHMKRSEALRYRCIGY
jgi:hypothetical protein